MEPANGRELADIYRARFSDVENRSKDNAWEVLCSDVFQQWVPRTGTVLDLGAGRCEFINNIQAAHRIAVDLNPDTPTFADDGVRVILTSSTDLHAVDDGSVDTVFSSNFFEHLPDKSALVATLAECHRVLDDDGHIVVMMPNIRYLAGRYWDYFDHHLPLTHLSLSEVLTLTGFEPVKVVPRFIPYTSKDSPVTVPRAAVRLYLRFPPAWRFMGRQMLVVARKGRGSQGE
jgi:SAM-dependent methyltransferase